MPLTEDERFQKERDQILTLTAQLMTLRSNVDHPNYPQNMQPILDQLDLFAQEAEFQDHIDAASKARSSALNDVMESALGDLADVAKDISPLGAEMARAREIAEKGERELTLPKIAAVSATALASLESLLISIESLGAADLDESAAAVKNTVATLKDLIEKLPKS
jgi:hypothetical protein